jgi:ectoine hydroxylase-related dioxygenase (phytanoyl-CoA dioxygenase family)
MEVVNTLCASSSSVTVDLSAEERDTGVILASSFSLLYGLLKLCGVAHISNAVDATVSSKLNLQVQSLFDSYTAIKGVVGTPCGGVGEVACHQGERVASRDHSHTRWELKLPVNDEFIKPAIIANNFTIPVLKTIMSSNSIEIDTYSAIVSLPSSPNQLWHQDVDPLFVSHGDMLTSANNDPLFNLPPAGIVAIVPLCDVSASNGPTEFAAGTHFSNIAPWKKMWLEWNSKILESSDPGSYDDMTSLEPKVPLLSLSLSPSSVILFDNRLVHRGRRNKSTQSRAIVYMSYLLDWFKDSVNFRDANTKEWGALKSGRVKKLTSRLDSHHYIKVLEDKLEALGVNLSEVRNAESKVKKSEMFI